MACRGTRRWVNLRLIHYTHPRTRIVHRLTHLKATSKHNIFTHVHAQVHSHMHMPCASSSYANRHICRQVTTTHNFYPYTGGSAHIKAHELQRMLNLYYVNVCVRYRTPIARRTQSVHIYIMHLLARAPHTHKHTYMSCTY